MSNSSRLPMPALQWEYEDGIPLSGGKLYVYLTGSSTPSNSFTDPSLDIIYANTNPVVANSSGIWPDIFLNPSLVYKLVLKDSLDVTIKTWDPIAIASGDGGGATDGSILTAEDETANYPSSRVATAGAGISTTDAGAGSTFTISASANLRTSSLEFIIDGAGSAITTGVKGDLRLFAAYTITEVTLLADQSGSIVVDIWKDVYGSYPPTGADSICASAKPTISATTKSTDTTLTGWTTTITAGDTLRFNVDSITTCTRVTVAMKILKTS